MVTVTCILKFKLQFAYSTVKKYFSAEKEFSHNNK